MTRAAILLIGFVALAVLGWPQTMTAWLGGLTTLAMNHAGSWFLWFSTGLLLLGVVLALSPAGRLRLGGEDERPEFGLPSWLAMLFAAGMGSGLVFWGVAEPLTHVGTVPEMALPDAAIAKPAATAMAITWFHWGLHAWAIYALAALAIAWFHTRRGSAEMPSASIELGWKGWLPAPIPAWLGEAADLLGIAAVVFGVAGALANSIILLGVGLDALLPNPLPRQPMYLGLLALLTAAFMTSAATGISHGIRWLSNLNLMIALGLLIILFVISDPTGSLGLDALRQWISGMPSWSLHLIEVSGSNAWADGWTVTYLIWWIAWTPFVGLFIARISRGRTLRAFLMGVIFMPTCFSIIWFVVLGGGALAFEQANGGLLTKALDVHYTRPLFLWLDALPMGTLLAWASCALLFVFMVTSADSASYVLGMLSSGNPRPDMTNKLGWGALLTVLTAGLLLRDDVDVNKTVAILGAIPFSLFLVFQVVGLLRDVISGHNNLKQNAAGDARRNE